MGVERRLSVSARGLVCRRDNDPVGDRGRGREVDLDVREVDALSRAYGIEAALAVEHSHRIGCNIRFVDLAIRVRCPILQKDDRKNAASDVVEREGAGSAGCDNLGSDRSEIGGCALSRKIVNVSSTSGVAGNAGQINYAAGKAGIVGMTKSLAKEWGRYNVNVNAGLGTDGVQVGAQIVDAIRRFERSSGAGWRAA